MVPDKLIRILTCYYRPKPGGFCARYFRAMRALLDEGCEVHYLAVTRFPVDHPDCYFHRFPWPEEKTESLLFWAVFHLFAPLFLLYLGCRLKITHAFAFGSTYGFFLQPLRLLKKIPVSLFLRGDPVAHYRSRNRSEWLIRLELLVEGLALPGIHLYTVSDSLRDTIPGRHRVCAPRSSITLRNDIPKIDPDRRKAYFPPLSVVCVGMLERHKNLLVVIDALECMDTHEIILSLYGQGVEEQNLRDRVSRMKNSSAVRFMGWVEAERIWKATDVLLMPSLFEGSPNVVLEALGRGVPVLASDIPAHREILPESCLLDAKDAGAWCRYLRKIVANPEPEIAMLLESQGQVKQKLVFDWDQTVCRAILGPVADTQTVLHRSAGQTF